MAEQRQLIYKILLDLGNSPEIAAKGAAQIDKITSSANQASAATENLSQKTKTLSKLQTDQARSAGLAGATAFELGRTISDLPFGFVAISNNLSQMGTLFAALVANAKGLKNALALLRVQLLNPVTGILIGFQIVTAALTFLSQRMSRSKRELNDLTNEIASSTTNLLILKKAIDSQSLSFERLSVLVAQVNDDNKNLNLSLKDSEDSYKSTSEQIREYVKALELAAKVKAVQSAVEEEFKIILKEQEEQTKNTVASYNFIGKAYAGVKGAIVDFYQGISGAAVTSEAKIVKSQSKITELMIELERLFAQGFTGDPKKTAEDGANEIAELQEKLALARIKSEENRLNKELEFIDAKLQKEEEGTEKFLNLQIRREAVLDSLSKIAQERDEENAEKKERLRQLDQELILESTSDEQERIRKKISFLNEEIAKEEQGAEKYKELQLEKIKAVNELAKAEERLRKEQEKSRKEAEEEDNRVNALRAKLFAARIEGNLKLEKKWTQSQIDSLNNILNSEKINKEQRAQAELDLFELKRRLIEIETQQTTSAIDGFKKAIGAISDILSAQAERDIAIETNRTTAVNDQLKTRLANEQLNAEQRDKINQQISRNDAALVGRQNEIAKKQFERDKAFKIAIALGDTASSALRAYASQIIPFDPTSVVRAKIAAGLATAFGLAQVAALTRLTFTQKALPTPNLVSQGSGQSSGPTFNVVGSSTRNQLAEAVSAALSDKPIKAFVVSSDVSSAQELERKIIEGASI